jgi:hypothetical protein
VQNGNVYIDGVKSISSKWAVSVGGGGPPSKKDLANNPDAKPGIFGSQSYIKNIHAVFGTTAQIGKKGASGTPEAYLKDLKVLPDSACFTGPSFGVVSYGIQNKAYQIAIENVTEEGFIYNKGIVYPDGTELQGGARWAFSAGLDGADELADKKAMKHYHAESKKKKTDRKKEE